MADVKWIKLATDIFDNRKIKQIERMPEGDALIVVWLKLLVLAGNVNNSGSVYFTRDIPYTDQLLATEFARPLNIIQLALGTFQRFGMIDIVEDVIHISNWEKYQNIEGMELIREQGRKRVAAFRERQRLALNDGGNVTCNVTVTAGNAIDKDIDIEEDKKENKKEDKKENNHKADVGKVIDEFSMNADLRAALRAFIEFRKEIKKPLSEHALALLTGKLNKLASTDEEKIEILNNSILNGWQGIYPLEKGKSDGRTGTAAYRGRTQGKYQPIGSGETVLQP